MSDGLTQQSASPEFLDARPGPARRSPWLVVPAQALAIVALFAAVGAAAGWLWYKLWDVPSGVVSGGQWYTGEAGLRDDFQGVGWYITLALVAGLVLGMLTAWLFDRSELVTLGAVLVGSALAAYIMLRVGTHLSPPDPHELAKTAQDGDKLKGALRIDSWAPKGAFPFGALIGLALVYAVSIGRPPRRGHPGKPVGVAEPAGRLRAVSPAHCFLHRRPGKCPETHPEITLSSTLPPPPPPPRGPTGPPPSGRPPSGPPPSGPPEYLESGGGAPLPQESGGGGRAVRRGLFVGGGVVGLVAVSVGAWAAYNFLTTGPQPAEALPAGTLGYVSIDLDPSGGQKLEALQTLNKFPAFKDYVGINADDDLRKEIVNRIQDEAQCDDIDYADDIEPWLGDRAAMAAVDVGGDDPDPVFVLQVKDAAKADAGLDKIKACGGGEGDEVGWAIEGDWAVIAESDDIADDVVAATKKGSLADDEDFKHWTDEAGDAGVLTLYAGPAAGDYLADHADDLFGFPLALMGGQDLCIPELEDLPGDDDSSYSSDGSDDNGGSFTYEGGFEGGCDVDDPSSAISDDLKDKFRDFKGMAATLRFNDGAIELEMAGDSHLSGQFLLADGGASADVVKTLPADTAAAYGLGFADGWFGDIIDTVASYTGESPDDLMSELSDMTGLDLPADAETLAGDSAALSLGSDFDPDVFFSSEDGSDIPVAVKIQGDPDEIEKVLDKLRDMAGPQANVLESDANGDTIVIGPNSDYRSEVLKDGSLGDDDVFKDVVREADEAQTVLFVNVNDFEDAIADAMGDGDGEFLDNLKPVSGFGVTGWVDGDTSHAVVRLTTD